MKLTWFGHSAFRMEIAGAVIMLDPFLANPRHKGDHARAYQGASHVVITHGHGDHIGSTVEICKATGATLVANPEIRHYLAAKGVKKTESGNFGGTINLGAFTVSFVLAWHSSSDESEVPVDLGHPAGIVIAAPGEKPLLHMGDTGIFSDMALINELYQPKVGIVPVGDRFTMGGRLAAIACTRFYDFDVAIPCHFGTFGKLAQSADEFIAGMKGSRTKVVLPEIGEAFEV